MEKLKSIAKEFGMEVIEDLNFLDFYKQEKEEHQQLFFNIGLKYDGVKGMDPQLWEICQLYKVVVFQKHGGLDQNINREFMNINRPYRLILEGEMKLDFN